MAYQNNRGNYGNNQNTNRTGGSYGGSPARGSNNARGGTGTNSYVKSSTVLRFFVDDSRVDPKTGKGHETKGGFDQNVTEKTVLYLNKDEVQHLIDELQATLGGEDGASLTLFGNVKTNRQTGDNFDSVNILVKAKKSRQGQGGSFRGNGGGGRKSYPPSQGQGQARSHETPVESSPETREYGTPANGYGIEPTF